jgi:hypothetical protein
MNRKVMQEALDILRLVNPEGELLGKRDQVIASIKEELGKIEDNEYAINNYYNFHTKQTSAYFDMIKESDAMIKALTIELTKKRDNL